MSTPSQLDTMFALLSSSEPAISKTASAPAASPVTSITPAPALPTPARVDDAAMKIAGAEDAAIRESARVFGEEFARSAAATFERNNVFPKVASAPSDDATQAAFRAGFEKGTEASLQRWRLGYASQLKLAHDVATAAHYSGQQHSAMLRKNASAVDANGVAKSASAGLGPVLAFFKAPEPSSVRV